MSIQNLYQSSIYPNTTSGVLPPKEGLVIFTNPVKILGAGQFSLGKPLKIQSGYFFLLLNSFFTFPAGITNFLRAYPQNKTEFKFFTDLSSDEGLDLVGLVNPLPIPASHQIVPAFFNGAADSIAFYTVYGIHLRDCAENRSNLGIG